MRRACTKCREYWEAQGCDLRGFNVIEAAADVDEIRRHLGYDEITTWGGSFGSHWGMAVMRYHPEGVARAVLTGMEGPDHTYDMPSGVLGALERMAAEAEASSILADDLPEDGLIQALRDVIADVEEEPIEIEFGSELIEIGPEDLRDLALGYTNRAGSRGGIRTWPADVIALYRGDFERVARALRQRRNDDSNGLPTASFFMLDCGSGISPEREAQLNSDPATAVVGNLGRFYQVACKSWDADLGGEFRAGFATDIPTVIVHGTWDISTPFENALELLPYFNDGHFIVVEGGTHGALGEAMRQSEAFKAALMRFATTGDRSELPTELSLPPNEWAPAHPTN